MGRIADVLSELTLLGAVGGAVPEQANAADVAGEEEGEDPAAPTEEYDPVALLTAGFKNPIADADEAQQSEAESEEDTLEEDSTAEDSDPEVTVADDEDAEDEDDGEDADEEVDLAETVSQLLKNVEAMSEQMHSVLWAVRELDALLKGDD